MKLGDCYVLFPLPACQRSAAGVHGREHADQPGPLRLKPLWRFLNRQPSSWGHLSTLNVAIKAQVGLSCPGPQTRSPPAYLSLTPAGTVATGSHLQAAFPLGAARLSANYNQHVSADRRLLWLAPCWSIILAPSYQSRDHSNPKQYSRSISSTFLQLMAKPPRTLIKKKTTNLSNMQR